jgi:hypothetical protein
LEPDGALLPRSGEELELEWSPVGLELASLPKYYLMLSKVRIEILLDGLFRSVERNSLPVIQYGTGRYYNYVVFCSAFRPVLPVSDRKDFFFKEVICSLV